MSKDERTPRKWEEKTGRRKCNKGLKEKWRKEGNIPKKLLLKQVQKKERIKTDG